MKIKIQVVIESDDGQVEDTQEVARFERDILKPEEVGLRLEESKKVLRGIQDVMVKRQVAGFMKEQRACPQCGQSRPRKGAHEVVYRTLFGKLSWRARASTGVSVKPRDPGVSVRWPSC